LKEDFARSQDDNSRFTLLLSTIGVMARPQTYSPARRFMMQGIMWIILGATVGLAALVSHHRRTSIDVKLGDAISYRGVTVQLPKGWEIVKTSDEQSAVVFTATEKTKDEDDEENGARVLKIMREPLGSYRSPIEYALSQLHPGCGASKIIQGQDYF